VLTDSSVGPEDVLVLRTPLAKLETPAPMDWLAAPPLLRRRGDGLGTGSTSPLADLLREAAFGDVLRARGESPRAAPLSSGSLQSISLELLDWQLALTRPTDPPTAVRGTWAATLAALNRGACPALRTGARGTRAEPPMDRAYEATARALVAVSGGSRHGAGVVIDEGHVLTSRGLVEETYRIQPDGTKGVRVSFGILEAGTWVLAPESETGIVEFEDPATDLALLRIPRESARRTGRAPVALAPNVPTVGEIVGALGHPGGAQVGVLDAGVVTAAEDSAASMARDAATALALGRAERDDLRATLESRAPPLMTTSCRFRLGSRGGPLVDREGLLVGLTLGSSAEGSREVAARAIRAFLAAADDARRRGAGLPTAAFDVGAPDGRIWARASAAARGAYRRAPVAAPAIDEVLAGDEEPTRLWIDVDGDSGLHEGGPERMRAAVLASGVDAEMAVEVGPARTEVLYDTDGVPGLDLALVDQNGDGRADIRARLRADGSWAIESGISVPLVRASHLPPSLRLPTTLILQEALAGGETR
jgi:hypothetical protein